VAAEGVCGVAVGVVMAVTAVYDVLYYCGKNICSVGD
jgi:hypothetical protein